MFTAVSFPDHYQTLGIAPGADEEAIRKAYRSQARKYHPDAAPDNPFAPAQFRALKEAYEVLSTPQKRRRYDEERWLRGITRAQTKVKDAAGLLADSEKLLTHLKRIGASSVAPAALQNLLFYLLQDKHLAIVAEEKQVEVNTAFAENILRSVGYLPLKSAATVLERLRLVSVVSVDFVEKLTAEMARQKRRQKQERLLPWLVILLTLALCFLIGVKW